MLVAKDLVVAMEYSLTDDEGSLIDRSEGDDFLYYLHGAGNIIPGLERELEGKKVGDELKVTVSPADGYGEFDQNRVFKVDKEHFAELDDVEPGMQLQVETDEGGVELVSVEEVAEDHVVLDGNHPLAGLTLHFEVKIREIREATPTELEHGHAHAPGHDHH